MKKPIRKKPARKPDKLKAIDIKLDQLTELVETMRAALRYRDSDTKITASFTHVVDEMGRALSDQIILLAKELPPNRHDGIIMRLDQLERRVNLLEKEATYTVRHVIEKPREETHNDAGTETPSGRVDREEPHDPGA